MFLGAVKVGVPVSKNFNGRLNRLSNLRVTPEKWDAAPNHCVARKHFYGAFECLGLLQKYFSLDFIGRVSRLINPTSDVSGAGLMPGPPANDAHLNNPPFDFKNFLMKRTTDYWNHELAGAVSLDQWLEVVGVPCEPVVER